MCFFPEHRGRIKAEARHDKGRQCMTKAKANENGKATIRQGEARQGKSRQLKGKAKAKGKEGKGK
ncbi:unnamed protein product [Prunus armeniaca]|uniref:Uncharacterized protein n=1 Tax=Prunus armeniaca TaxID=36596 RepID=A0A6J5U6C9_PRUAR|nr:unnamed protein product [Prunus armeniaca]